MKRNHAFCRACLSINPEIQRRTEKTRCIQGICITSYDIGLFSRGSVRRNIWPNFTLLMQHHTTESKPWICFLVPEWSNPKDANTPCRGSSVPCQGPPWKRTGRDTSTGSKTTEWGHFGAEPVTKPSPGQDNLMPSHLEHRLLSNTNLNYIWFGLSKTISISYYSHNNFPRSHRTFGEES